MRRAPRHAVLAAALALALALAVQTSVVQAAVVTIRVGAVLPLTGNDAPAMVDVARGTSLDRHQLGIVTEPRASRTLYMY